MEISEQTLARHIGPALFRMAWWAYLDPSRRKNFGDDLLDVISVGLVGVFEERHKKAASDDELDFAKSLLRSLIEDKIGSLNEKFSNFNEESFLKFIHNVTTKKGASKLNRLLAKQYKEFTSRTSNLSKSMIEAVKLINEEFLIWLKTHPAHTEQIHSDAFEQLSGEVLTSKGFSVEFTGRVKNLSADLLAIRAVEMGEEVKYLIECKRYGAKKKVDLNIVNAVIGASYRAKRKHALLLTTSSFTSNAVKAAAELEDIRLELHDGKSITEWLSSYNFKRLGLWLPEGWQDNWKSKK